MDSVQVLTNYFSLRKVSNNKKVLSKKRSFSNSIISLFSITPAYFVWKILRCDSVADVDHAWEGKGHHHQVLICSTFLQLEWLQFDI